MILIKPSVINQLKQVSKTLRDLEYYEMDVSSNDLTDAIFYSKLADQVDQQIKEIEKWNTVYFGYSCIEYSR